MLEKFLFTGQGEENTIFIYIKSQSGKLLASKTLRHIRPCISEKVCDIPQMFAEGTDLFEYLVRSCGTFIQHANMCITMTYPPCTRCVTVTHTFIESLAKTLQNIIKFKGILQFAFLTRSPDWEDTRTFISIKEIYLLRLMLDYLTGESCVRDFLLGHILSIQHLKGILMKITHAMIQYHQRRLLLAKTTQNDLNISYSLY